MFRMFQSRALRAGLTAVAVAAAGVFVGLAAPTEAQAQTRAEQNCFNRVQGRVDWGGGTTWENRNVRALCRGVGGPRMTQNRIACFQAMVGERVPWQRAIPACRERFAGGAGARPATAVRRIDCPLRQARTEMVSPLPNGWWQTPQVGNLQGTKIANVGGTPTLICLYQAYAGAVSVMFKQPRGLRCRARQGGFNCAR